MLKFARFIGANTDFATAQAFLFPRILPEASHENVFGLVISGEGEDVFVSVRQKVLNLEESFNAPFERITDKLHELLEKLKFEFRDIENLNFTIFCARENLFYVLQTGNNLVEILTEGARSPVFSGNVAKEKIISGFIKPGDRILILSEKTPDSSWESEVVSEILDLPVTSVTDAEVIFAKSAQKTELEEDLAGVKNILPVAFILIDNEVAGKERIPVFEPKINESSAKRRINLNIKPDFGTALLNLRKSLRIFFGTVRLINEKIFRGSRTAVIIFLIIILILLSGAGGYFYLKQKENEKNIRRDNLITLINAGLAQADSLKDSDRKASLEEMKKTSEKLKELTGLDPENKSVQDTKARFESKSNEILKIYKDTNLELFMSLDLIRANFKTKRMSFSVDKILLLDETEKSLVSIGIELKTPDILAGPTQLGSAQMASLNGSQAFVYSVDKGLLSMDTDTNKVSVVSAPDAGWGDLKDIFGFSDSLYVLDTGKNMIWKYAPAASGFSQKQAYLRAESNLSQGKQLMIDYSVWVLTGEPDILKFTAGNSDYYAISGIDEPVTQIDRLWATEDADTLYLLDKSKNRILVTKKNGEYQAQYINPEFSKVDDFFVSEADKAIYLLIENKIYKTPIR